MIIRKNTIAIGTLRKMITFNEEDHKYFNEHGVEYISCTTFLGMFKKPFETDKHAERIAQRDGTTMDAVKNAWKGISTSISAASQVETNNIFEL